VSAVSSSLRRGIGDRPAAAASRGQAVRPPFLDGNHRFEGVFLDLIYSGRLLKEGGVVFVDDTQLRGVRRAVDFCVANLGWLIEEEGEAGDDHGWLVVRTGPSDAFLRPFFEFVVF
jgi:hypothetical protein